MSFVGKVKNRFNVSLLEKEGKEGRKQRIPCFACGNTQIGALLK